MEPLDRKLLKEQLTHFDTLTEDMSFALQTPQEKLITSPPYYFLDQEEPRRWKQMPVIARLALFFVNNSQLDKASQLVFG